MSPALLFTVIKTVALVVVCPPALLAVAESEWLPLERVEVFKDMLNGALVSAAPELALSTRNCTRVVFADTLVETVMLPETVAPVSGDVMEMVGAPGLLIVTLIAALVVVCPAALLATAVNEWLPLDRLAVFREVLNGALVSAAPELVPSTLN